MTAARTRNWKGLAFLTALMTVVALAVPFVEPAVAQVAGDNTGDLQVEPETDSNATGSTHTLTATVSNITGTVEVDFEVESGPTVRVNCTNTGGAEETCTGGTANSDNNALQPDMTCTINVTVGQTSCNVNFTSDASGTNVVRSWIDDDKDNATFDADQTEGRDEATAPGSRTEVDDTDVVEKSWFGAVATNAAIDCVDESGDDTQVNPAGQSETYTCTTFNDNGTGGGTAGNAVRDGTEPVIAGLVIDAEIARSNDPDNLGFAAGGNTTADRNDACTTNSSGTCTITISPTKNETGPADICFWIDADNDAQFAAGGDRFDGGQCEAERTGAENTSQVSDVVLKDWQQPAAARLEAEPEVANNASGTSHTVTAQVTDQFGNPSAGTPVDFTITAGRNVALTQICNDVLTNASGTATCTYTDTGTATTSGQDTIRVNRDGAFDPTEARNETGAGAGTTPEPDLTDVVTKFWTAGGPPAASTVIVDMAPGNGCADAADSADSEEVGTDNPICGTVRDSAGAAIPGKSVTLTYDGPGEFGSDANTNGNLDAGEGRGKTITVTADEQGRFDATLFSTATGRGTVTATADNASDTGTKTWTTPAAGARNIDCEPDTARNDPGTSHVVTCTVTDRYGNAVPNVSVTPSETGPGRLNDATARTTNADGEVEFVVSSTANEEGTQTITAELTVDVPDADNAADTDDACDQPQGSVVAAEAGTTANRTGQQNAPAGNCENSVEKTWQEEEQPQPECSDGVDNDGDGKTDFPNDPNCDSAEDDSEAGPTPTGECAAEGAILGTDGNDVLVGTDGDDVICGFGGRDTIRGKGGDDILLGQGGNDTIEGGAGDDTAKGGGGRDVLEGNAGKDVLRGGSKADTLKGNKGHDTLRGGRGGDTLRGGRGNDTMRGGRGNDSCRDRFGDNVFRSCESR